MLAVESAGDAALAHVLGAQPQETIGYWIVQVPSRAALGKLAACQTVVQADDPAFSILPSSSVPSMTKAVLAAERGWDVRQDGQAWRRVVPSPEPAELVELDMIKLLSGSGRAERGASRSRRAPPV